MKPDRWSGTLLFWELCRTSRRPSFFVSRFLVAAALLSALISSYAYMISLIGDNPFVVLQVYPFFANYFFHAFCYVEVFAVLLFAIVFAAPAISGEKEKRTLDALYCTQLTPSEIVLSKWLVCVMGVLNVASVGIPIFLYSTMFGGYSLAQIVIVAVCVFATALSGSALALAISCRAKSASGAALASLGLSLALQVGLPFLIQLGAQLWIKCGDPHFAAPASKIAVKVLTNIHPFYLVTRAASDFDQYTKSELQLAIAVYSAIHLCVSGLLLLYAQWRMSRAVFLTSGDAQRSEKKGDRPGHRKNTHRFHDAPVFWREVIAWRRSAMLPISFCCLSGAALCYPILAKQFGWPNVHWHSNPQRNALRHLQFVSCGLFVLTQLHILIRGATSLTKERSQETWDSLRSTSLTIREIAIQKILAAQRPAFFLLSTMFPAWCLHVAKGSLAALSVPSASIVILVASLFSASVGVYLSALCSRSSAAMANSGAIGVAIFGALHWLLAEFLLFRQVYFWNGLSGGLFFLSCPTMIFLQAQFAPDQELMVLPLKADPKEGVIMSAIFLVAFLYAANGLYRSLIKRLENLT